MWNGRTSYSEDMNIVVFSCINFELQWNNNDPNSRWLIYILLNICVVKQPFKHLHLILNMAACKITFKNS